MDFSFSEEQELFRSSLREGLSKHLTPRVKELDSKGEIPRETIREMARMGILGMTISEEYGGMGADMITTTIAAEEVGRADITLATAVYFLLEAGWGYIFDRYGKPSAKEQVLPRVTSGEYFLGIASTEPGGGSDVAGEKTLAIRKGDKYVINGEKMYISGVAEAAKYGGGFLLVAKSAPELAHKGMSMIYTPVRDVPGVTTSLIRNMGREGISTGVIVFKDAELPADYLIGEENKGFYYAMEGFNHARVLVSAACIGAAQRVLELGIEYIKNREVFGQKLSKFQGVQFQLAEHYAKLEAARALVYKAAWVVDQHYKLNKLSLSEVIKSVSAVKWLAPVFAFDAIKEVATWFGAYGYSKDGPVEASVRGAFSYLMGAEGALNVMKVLLAKELLGKEHA
ncbi:acyl-CoA dehydrogenase [Candidatus Marsarchaeota G1 archaeon OSP_D]|uniref:Acyl-CoA dehydrogenase n=4 Tax=Candidatus Marsarchaeota TaxID=1978152 RepID=A0A2R6AJ81_9ARCH|nr:MAG: acyl-CoA dehydrogenase [Candidatus Marsarchaeota G1 archaeon OSP_D]PSN86440.1 MAG: acyl-CoA dehydrogenase [Candidatus Marsarchaeota G1 archaeon BE_D]PSN89305.1 MAG: acyl-CoA dehydrogenase [Candidatus Marsarchaeota G1 archaeon OSP_C]PSO03087.1 MAG: acyl-CoA dehydrogenase [Candidatus Marsarchaeota G2 archaeon ECH_B_SAG-E12]